MAGPFSDSGELVYDAYEILQPAFDAALAETATELYAGEWRAVDSTSTARIVVDKGTLYVERFTLLGHNALETLGVEGRVALRSTRKDEFRCAKLCWFTIPQLRAFSSL